MKEPAFEKSSLRKMLSRTKAAIPEKVRDNTIIDLMDQGLVRWVDNYKDAVKAIDGLDEDNVVLFSSKFDVAGHESNYGIKSLEYLVKIDSKSVLEEIAGDENAPRTLTKDFAEKHKIWPYTLIKNAMKDCWVEDPPIGAYWIGTDNHARAFTWLRAIEGAEMKVLKNKKRFNLEVIDNKLYGNNVSVSVASRSKDEKFYEFSINRLPLSRKRDRRQYSSWIDLSHNSSDPDARYRGDEHNKRVQPVNLFSASTIAAFYEIMTYVAMHPSWRQFRINPFPIPKDKAMIDYVDNLRLGSIILRKDGHFDTLNKTSMDRLIGARIIERGYDDCFYHWGKRNTSYLVNA